MIKTTVSQQYTSFVFPFDETRSVDVTSVDRENSLCYSYYPNIVINITADHGTESNHNTHQ